MTKNDDTRNLAGTQENKDLETELSQFTGTTCYHRHWLGLRYTEGVKHLVDRAGAQWLIDTIASLQPQIKEVDKESQLWKLIVDEDDRSAYLDFQRDSVQPAIIHLWIEYTDFPLDSIQFYLRNGVLLLPSED